MAYDNSRANVHGLVGKWINVEEKVERECSEMLTLCTLNESTEWILCICKLPIGTIDRIKCLIPKDETMTPGILYVGGATMAGSIVGRTSASIHLFIRPSKSWMCSWYYIVGP